MNERIKQLAKQAGAGNRAGVSGLVFRDEELQKFAELIVKECVQRCEEIGFRWHAIDSTRASGAKAGAFECAGDLKKHFGVEE